MAAQQFITSTPILYLKANITQGYGGILLTHNKKWWWLCHSEVGDMTPNLAAHRATK